MLAQLIPPIPPVLLLALLPALAIIALPIVYVLYKLFSWFAPQKNRDTRSRIELLVASAVATIVLISTVGGLAFTFLGSATIHDHAEVKIIAQPGAHISTVVNEFGSPSESHAHSDGSQSYYYADGFFAGYTIICISPDGSILEVGYCD